MEPTQTQKLITEKLLTQIVIAVVVIAAMGFGLIDRELFATLLAIVGVRAGEQPLRALVKKVTGL